MNGFITINGVHIKLKEISMYGKSYTKNNIKRRWSILIFMIDGAEMNFRYAEKANRNFDLKRLRSAFKEEEE